MKKLPNFKNQDRSLDLINLLSTQTSKLTTKIAILSFETAADFHPLQITFLIIEYAQIMSQMILLYLNIDEDSYVKSSLFFQTIIYTAKAVNPGYLLSFNGNDNVIGVVLLVVLGFMFFKYILYLYIVIVALYDLRASEWVINLWKLIFKIQSRVLFSVVSSFWLSSSLAAQTGGFSPFQSWNFWNCNLLIIDNLIRVYLFNAPQSSLLLCAPIKNLFLIKRQPNRSDYTHTEIHSQNSAYFARNYISQHLGPYIFKSYIQFC